MLIYFLLELVLKLLFRGMFLANIQFVLKYELSFRGMLFANIKCVKIYIVVLWHVFCKHKICFKI